MANMSYCRFQNTASDFADCVNALEELSYDNEEQLSYAEKRAAIRMRDLCEEYLELFGKLEKEGKF